MNCPPITIGNTEIKRVSEIQFLGVTIDDKLSWDAHVKLLSKKLASCIGSINQIATYIPENLYINLYHTLFKSYFTYGITVWGSMSDTKLRKLFLAQKKLLEFCLGIEKNSRINLKHVSELGLTKSKNFPLNFT